MLDDNSLVIDDTTRDQLFPYLRVARPGSYFHNPGSAGGWARYIARHPTSPRRYIGRAAVPPI